MSEGRVSLDSQTYALDEPFLVIATQNPLEHFGTYPLPESQMDRFLLRIRMGYPDAGAERKVVTAPSGDDPIEDRTRYLVHYSDGGSGMRRHDRRLEVGDELQDGGASYRVVRVEHPANPSAFGHAWAERENAPDASG
jgi:hypothetical protein